MARHQYQNAHGSIGVRGPEGSYTDSIANFTTDYGQAPPPLPNGVIDQTYEPGRRHAYGDGEGNVIGGGDRVFAAGDAIIASLQILLDAQSARRAKEWEATAKAFRVEQKATQLAWLKEQMKLLEQPEAKDGV